MSGRFSALALAALLSIVAAPASLAEAPRSEQFETSCTASCNAKDKSAEYCVAYCTCMTREIFLGRPVSEVDKLHAAMQPQAPDSSEKDILKRLVGQCVDEALTE